MILRHLFYATLILKLQRTKAKEPNLWVEFT